MHIESFAEVGSLVKDDRLHTGKALRRYQV